jgi:NDP-sugar pyrophosphorylase family protein
MNIVYSLCGNGNRFKHGGFDIIKYLIPYNGAPMLYHSVNTLGIQGNLHFIVRDEHLLKYDFLEKFLLDLGGKITVCYSETQGAAESLLLCEKDIDDLSKPLISVNSDQYMDWNPKPFIEKLNKHPKISFVVTFKNFDPKCSYVRTIGDNILEVREKKVIGPEATVGIYHWATSKDFFIDAKEMIKNDVRDNGEFYVAPVYNFTIARNLSVKIFNIETDQFFPVGTPEDLEKLIKQENFFD